MRGCSLVFLFVGLLPAQVRGLVTGFDGKPADAVIVNLRDRAGDHLADTTTGISGHYAFAANPDATTVVAWLEGVELQLPLDGRDHYDFGFHKAAFFTLRGHAVDPEGKPLPGVEIDGRNDEGHCLCRVVAGDQGAFTMRSNQPFTHLLLAPGLWDHRIDGPFAKDQGVAIDLRPEAFFRLRGTLRDENGGPVAGARLHVRDLEGRNIAAPTTTAAGVWSAWCNRPVHELWITLGTAIGVTAPGPWERAADVALDWRSLGLIALSGRAVDADGKPVAHARLVPWERRVIDAKPVAVVGTTDADGRFRVLVRRGTRFLIATRDTGNALAEGPFGQDAELVLRPDR